MRSFLKFLLSSTLGAILGLTFFFLIIVGVFSAMKGGKKEKSVSDNSLLVIKLDREIAERKSENPFASFSGMGDKSAYGLDHLLRAIKKAEKDDKIKGILLEQGYPITRPATLQALRNALVSFKKSGKFILSYSEAMTEGGYYLASTADKIHLYPTGALEWNGLGSNMTFLRGMLDKLGVKPILFRVGGYKSAAEMIVRKDLSAENREQISVLLNDIWGTMLEEISASRKGIDVAGLNDIANNIRVISAKSALETKLVDALSYEDQVNADLRKRLQVDKEEDKIPRVEIADYATEVEHKSDNEIAVIYAVGGIQSGEGDDETIGSETVVKAIREARENKNVKAIVLRVNSGGGSALASDVIGREVEITRAKKPVIASFGDVAASGGYYISAQCDQIVCEPMTITGSIGVIGLLLNTQQFFNDKIGITFDRVVTNDHADIGNPNRTMTEVEHKAIQDEVDLIYEDFLAVVKKGRKFAHRDSVHKLAQGRVWSGKRALDHKLVDALGGIDVALTLAAKKAGLGEEYSVVEYPKFKNPIQKILENFNSSVEARLASRLMTAEQMRNMKQVFAYRDPRHVYAVMPFWIEIQ
jgi:protease IV